MRVPAKQRILDTASRLFAERGYSEVGINEIIEKSGTAKATFYHHFPSKEALCEAWLLSMHDRSEVNRQNIINSDGPVAEKVVTYFQGLRDYLKNNEFRGCPFSNTAAVCTDEESTICRHVEDHKLGIRDFFRDLASEFTATGARAREIGDVLFVLYSGASVEAQNLKAMWPVDAAIQAAREICERENC